MTDTHKFYESSFVVEKPKLERLIAVVESAFSQVGATSAKKFQVGMGNDRLCETTSLQEVYSLDNSKKNRITSLAVEHRAKVEDVSYFSLVDFDERYRSDIRVTVRSENSAWVHKLFSEIDEQIERVLKRELTYRLLNLFGLPRRLVLLLGIALTMLVGMIVLATFGQPSRLERTMWLNEGDLAELEKDLAKTPDKSLTEAQARDILSRQVRLLIHDRKGSFKFSSLFASKRFYFIVLPLIVVIGSLFYLPACYPQAVFLWGDVEEWYKNLLKRRTIIWTGILVAFTVEILAAMFWQGVVG